ncbi:MAG: S46 family peptidase, partial [Pseudomonadota bacterium]
MFTPDQAVEIAADMRRAGLRLKPDTLTDLTSFPMGAVISLGGCTASFVSETGLVVTNHHCARGSVQFNSSAENNYLETGFLADTLEAELPAEPGSRVYVTVDVQDVTERVLAKTSEEMSPRERYQAIEDATKALIKECEAAEGYRCQAPAFFGGLQYKLIKRLEIRDVRLVYAPGDTVGKYGGDIDNWLWPRHTGDFAFYRAYVAQDGSAADYSEDNVPYQPEHTLKVSAA